MNAVAEHHRLLKRYREGALRSLTVKFLDLCHARTFHESTRFLARRAECWDHQMCRH